MSNLKQMELLKHIKHFITTVGYSPSVRELMNLMDSRSHSYIHDKLKELEQMGLIKWNPKAPRTIRVVEED